MLSFILKQVCLTFAVVWKNIFNIMQNKLILLYVLWLELNIFRVSLFIDKKFVKNIDKSRINFFTSIYPYYHKRSLLFIYHVLLVIKGVHHTKKQSLLLIIFIQLHPQGVFIWYIIYMLLSYAVFTKIDYFPSHIHRQLAASQIINHIT